LGVACRNTLPVPNRIVIGAKRRRPAPDYNRLTPRISDSSLVRYRQNIAVFLLNGLIVGASWSKLVGVNLQVRGYLMRFLDARRDDLDDLYAKDPVADYLLTACLLKRTPLVNC
jgi:hypothetical protein